MDRIFKNLRKIMKMSKDLEEKEMEEMKDKKTNELVERNMRLVEAQAFLDTSLFNLKRGLSEAAQKIIHIMTGYDRRIDNRFGLVSCLAHITECMDLELKMKEASRIMLEGRRDSETYDKEREEVFESVYVNILSLYEQKPRNKEEALEWKLQVRKILERLK